MSTIFEAMQQFLDEDEWPTSPIQDTVLRTTFQGKTGQWTCFAQAREEQEQMVFYSVCPMNVPEERRTEVARYLSYANYGLIIGNFEIDLRDGEVRYKTSIDVEGGELEQHLIKPIVYTNVLMMDKYLPGLSAVTHGGMTAEGAIAMIEGDGDDDDEDEDD